MAKLIRGVNDLATKCPELAAQWDYEKNGNLKPEDVTAGSSIKVWWLLPYTDSETGKHFDFEWEATINSRTKGAECPYLSGYYAWEGYNDLTTVRPDLATQWHPYKNGNLKPKDVTVNSNKKVWWKLPYDDPITGKHFDFEWEAEIASRVKGIGCPYLSGQAVWKGYNDLATLRPDLASQWHLYKNGNLNPEDVTAGSRKKVWWLLPYADSETGKHFNFEWQAIVKDRTKGIGCPYLSGQAVWKGYNDLKTVNPILSEQWHPYKNRNLKPEDVTVYCNKKVWWFLPYTDSKTGMHFDFEWLSSISSRVNGAGCPYLIGKAAWKGYNDLATTHPELAKEWHYDRNGSLKPEDVTAGSHKKVWWILPYDDPDTGRHFDFEWEATINSRTKGAECPYLSIPAKAILAGFNDFSTTHPKIAAQWHPYKNGDLKPEDVTAGSNKKVWWMLSYTDSKTGMHFDFEWPATVRNRTNGSGCPYIISPKIERLFKEFLDTANIVHTPHRKFSGCKDKKKLEFDEYLEELIKMMEGDGIQHFRIVDHWDKEEEDFLIRRKHDEMKDEFCIRENIPLLRIPYIYDADKDKNEIEEIMWDFILYNTIPRKIRDFYESEGRHSYIKVLEHFNTKFS